MNTVIGLFYIEFFSTVLKKYTAGQVKGEI